MPYYSVVNINDGHSVRVMRIAFFFTKQLLTNAWGTDFLKTYYTHMQLSMKNSITVPLQV
jgi:hypothetical protein